MISMEAKALKRDTQEVIVKILSSLSIFFLPWKTVTSCAVPS